MTTIAPPKPVRPVPFMPVKRDVQSEPPTGRALWPTFMRRTLDDEQVKACPRESTKAEA